MNDDDTLFPTAAAPESSCQTGETDEPTPLEQEVIAMVSTIFDPEIPVNIYELGLIYGIECSPEGDVVITMTLTSPHCPVAESMPGEVTEKVRAVPGVRDVQLDLVWDPPWGPDRMSEAARLELGMI